MSGVNKHREKEDSEDDFRYEEVSLEDDCSLTEGEEDLEATVKAIKDRAEASAAARSNTSTHAPEAVDDFLRNFLSQMCMTETLDCFQTEWTEVLQTGQVNTEMAGVVPEVYTDNKHLESALKNAQREQEEYRQAGCAAAETLQRVQRARDFHRLQHKRLVQEKNRVIEEMRKLKTQCHSYEPEVKRMNEKYKAVLKQTMLVSLERDKVKSAQHRMPYCEDTGEEGAVDTAGRTSVKGTTHHMIQPRPPSSAKSHRASPRRANRPTL